MMYYPLILYTYAGKVLSIGNIVNLNKQLHLAPLSSEDLFGQPTFTENGYGTGTLIMSFLSNVAATSFIAYRAW
jgi:hypothetical protein